MTAKESRNQTLWNRLPNVVKDFITNAVYNGKFKVDIEYRIYATTNREVNDSIIENLRKLGYTVNRTEDYTIQISWD